jgi:thiamine-phosphate pyrophosphorylase
MKKYRVGMNNFLAADIYALTGEEYSLGRTNIEVVRQMLGAGVKVIQYREKDKKMGAMYQECLKIAAMTRRAGATLIINDYVELALAVSADGVHIGQDDLPPAVVRRLIGDDMIIGLSTHSPEQALAAANMEAVDYIGVGPIYSTQTKKDVCAPVGLDYLEYVAGKIDVPFVAIGGIKEHNITEVRARGARVIALVTEIVGAENIPAKIQSLRNRLAIVNQ